MELRERAAGIKLIVFDVDGVLTDGKIIIGTSGELFKSFDAHDGLGISLLRLAGIKTAVITGRNSQIVSLRSVELKIDEVYQGATNKLEALRDLQKKYAVDLNEIAYVGDDLMDIPVLESVGLACAVNNAVKEVKEAAHYIATKGGGNGAVRQIAELILTAKGKWAGIIASYTNQKPLEDTMQ